MSCEDCRERFERLYDQLQYEYREDDDGVATMNIEPDGKVTAYQ